MSSSNQRPANRGFRSVLRCAISHYRQFPWLSAPEPDDSGVVEQGAVAFVVAEAVVGVGRTDFAVGVRLLPSRPSMKVVIRVSSVWKAGTCRSNINRTCSA